MVGNGLDSDASVRSKEGCTNRRGAVTKNIARLENISGRASQKSRSAGTPNQDRSDFDFPAPPAVAAIDSGLVSEPESWGRSLNPQNLQP
jgi:hypothetical protein